MTDNTQRAIIVQTCAKIAAEILVHAPITDCEGTIGWWKEYFHEVLEEVTNAIGEPAPQQIKSGRSIPVLKQDDMQMKLSEYTAMAGSATSSDTITSDDIGLNPMPVKKMKRVDYGDDSPMVTIKNSSEKPPAWLIRAAVNKNVTEVFDNRPNKKDNPKRPDFVSTGEDKTGFWAPQER